MLEKKCTSYITAKRVAEVHFIDGAVNCVNCRYSKCKSGLYQKDGVLERYSNFICLLTYSPINDVTTINENCPLEWDTEEEEQ